MTAGAARPPRATALSASLAFAWRALLKLWHVPEQLIEVVSTPIMFTLLFTYLFGGALGGSTSGYLQLLLPGTLVMTVLLISVFTGVGLNTDLSTGVFDRFRSLPVWRPAALVGALLGDVARNVVASAIVLALGFAMGFHAGGGPAGVLLAVALLLGVAFGLAWIWTALALVLRTPSAVSNVGLLVMFPLTFASNVFVDPDTMPGWLHTFVDINPVSHLVSAVRGLMAGTASGAEVAWVLVTAAALTAIFGPLTMRLYRNRG